MVAATEEKEMKLDDQAQEEENENGEAGQNEEDEHLQNAHRIVHKHALLAAGLGAIPVPLVDVAGIMAANLRQGKELAEHYGETFIEHAGKSIVGSLISGLGSGKLATGVLGVTLKSLPGIGSIIGVATVSVFAGALTYATGKTFVKHFQSGGTLLDFDVPCMKGYFADKFKEGKSYVSEMMNHKDEAENEEEEPKTETKAKKKTKSKSSKKS